MKIAEEINSTLRKAFEPEVLEVINESHKHAGHAENKNGGDETHFKIIISGKDISGGSRLEKHKKINAALGEIIKKIHALEIKMVD